MLKGLTRWNLLAVSDFHQLVEGSRCSSYLLGTKAWSWSVFPWIAAQRVLGRPGTKLDFKGHAVLAAVLLKFPTRNCRSWMLSFSSMPSPPAPRQYSCWAFAHFHSHCSDLDALFSSPLELLHTSIPIAVTLTLFSVLLLSCRTLPFSLQWSWRCFHFSCWVFAHFRSHCSDLDAVFSSPVEFSHTSVLIAVTVTLFSVHCGSIRRM